MPAGIPSDDIDHEPVKCEFGEGAPEGGAERGEVTFDSTAGS